MVLKVDDFNTLHIKGLPASANTPKFTTALTIANCAVKFHEAARLELGTLVKFQTDPEPDFLSSWIANVHSMQSAGMIYGRVIKDDRPTYFTIRAVQPLEIKKLYQFSIATASSSLKNFYVFASVANEMKTLSQMEEMLTKVSEFAEPYTSTNQAILVGDFYVFKNVLRVVSRPDDPRHGNILPWLDSMHIGLNAQEALVKWGYTVLLPIWNTAFPDAPFKPFKMRPIRRIALLTLVLVSWGRVRDQVFQNLEKGK